MPKARRPSAAAAADIRPAFNRPPGAKVRAPAQANETTPSPPKRSSRPKAKESPATSPVKKVHGQKHRDNQSPNDESPSRHQAKHASAKLNAHNTKVDIQEKERQQRKKEKQYKYVGGQKRRKKNRNVSGARLEEGRANEKNVHVRRRGGAGSVKEYMARRSKGQGPSRRALWMLIIITLILLIVFIPVGVLVIGKDSSAESNASSGPSTESLKEVDPNSIPAAAKGSDLDPFTWYDTSDFNVTYTDEEVGGLSIMGLNTEYDDSARPNDNVPPLSEQFEYGKMPIRGVNVGGWLAIEPFITPSLFDEFATDDEVNDEWTLTQKLGPGSAKAMLEAHYANFVNEQTFVEIAEAGMDHVRIPFGYWAVTTYDGDPYVPKTAWRYLLRSIEWCRKYGLRVKLDVHGLPGSQNGWNHSGRWGKIGWISGSDGAVNAKRSLDMHDQLSQFFAQERYKNVLTLYGLGNEPKMIEIGKQKVNEWNKQAVDIVRKNGIKQHIVFSDGFLALNKWEDELQGVDSDLVMDTHQYVIFNTKQLGYSHQNKIDMVCQGWSSMFTAATSPSTGWGPLICGEWSQADTDCAKYLNNVGTGSRWAGTMNTEDPETQVLTPSCPEPPCSCDRANANPSQYSESYKQFLKMFAEAQIHSFEQAWGWFYWTWQTESAVHWSWKLGREAGILPEKAYAPDFKCDSAAPAFSDLE